MKNNFKYFFIILSTLIFLGGCSGNIGDEYVTSFEGLVTHEDIVIFPEPNSLIQIEIDTLGKDLPSLKDDGGLAVLLRLTAGGASLDTYGEIKVQGSSTAKWPKKNWSLKFYADKERTQELRIKLGDSVASDKWITKAEWVDPSLLRNALSFRLWEAMVKARDIFPQYEVDKAWFGQENMEYGVQTAAQGFPKSYPSQIRVNGQHYGISILILGHDPENFNIDKNNPKHVYMEFDARGGYTNTKTWDKFSSDGIGQWIDGYFPKNEDFTEEQKESIDALGRLINGSQDYFEENFHKYLDKDNIIDMFLFLEVIYDYDALAQDIEMVTYDLEKWYFLPWDKDTSFGMSWDGKGVRQDSSRNLLIDYSSEKENQRPWFKTYRAFKPDIEARYKDLRDKGVFSAKGLYELTGDITKKIPREVWEAERERWAEEERPSLDETSTYQIISWFQERLEMLDGHFNYIKRE